MTRGARKDLAAGGSNDGEERASEKGAPLRDDGLQPGERKLANELRPKRRARKQKTFCSTKPSISLATKSR